MAYLVPFAKSLLDKTFDVVKDQLSRVDVQHAADATKALATTGMEAAKIGAANIDVMEITVTAKDWTYQHSGQISWFVANGLITFFPGLVTVPALNVVGYGAQGVIAGSRAATLQAGVGNVAAKSTFAYLQSAGMGGYGLMVVNGVVRGAAVMAQGAGPLVAVVRKQLEKMV